MESSFKEKFTEIRTCSPMNNVQDPQKKRRCAFCCFSSQSKPNLNSKNSKHSNDMPFPQFHPLEKRIQSLSFNPPTHASLDQTLSFV